MSIFQEEEEGWNYGFITKIILVFLALVAMVMLMFLLIVGRFRRKRNENVNENIVENIKSTAQSHENMKEESQAPKIGFVLFKSCEQRDIFLQQVNIDEGILDLIVEENFDKTFEEFENMDVFRLARIIQRDTSIFSELDIDSQFSILEMARNYDENIAK